MIIMEVTQAAQFIFTALFALIIYFSNPPKENHVAMGDYYYQSFDNNAAQQEYEQAYNESPTSYASLLRMVRIHNDKGRIHLRKDSVSELEYKKVQQRISGMHWQKEALFRLLVFERR
jgi:hypothetical protein